MEASYSRIVNYNVSVREIDGKVVFLRKLERGGSEHSFGIHVAKLAGMPQSIVRRATEILEQLEGAASDAPAESKADTATPKSRRRGKARIAPPVHDTVAGMQLSFFQLDDPVLSQVRDELLGVDINNLTPLEALKKLNDIRGILTGKHS